MIIDFKNIEFDAYNNIEPPVLILKKRSGDVIGTLGNYFNLQMSLRWNDVSEISFNLPQTTESSPTPYYKDIKGMNIITVEPYGSFVLINPQNSNDGVKEVRTVKGYSLEYEFNYKKIYIPSGTYNFWNPVDKENTILKIIMELMPNWTLGEVDSSLIGKYRTFDTNESNLFGFIMNTLQQSYNCFFLYDTTNRIVHIKDANSQAQNVPVFLSFDNLIKNVEVEELTEDVVTCLSAYGADPVTIRTVNPMGTNKIYNLDYYMRNGEFNDYIKDKWKAWSDNYKKYQEIYGRTNIAYNVQLTDLSVQRAKLTQLKEELGTLQQEQSAIIETSSLDDNYKSKLKKVKNKIKEKETEITLQTESIERSIKELQLLTDDKKDINKRCSFSSFFSAADIKMLDLYFKEDTLQDTTFVLANYNTYTTDDFNQRMQNGTILITSDYLNEVETELNKRIFDFKNGKLQLNGNNNSVSGDIVKTTFEFNTSTKEFLLSAFLNAVTVNDASYPSANLSCKGTYQSLSDSKTMVNFIFKECTTYLTKSVTEYQQMIVEQELYDYACDCLKKSSEPSYRFSVDCGNFLFLQEFKQFRDVLALGKTITLALDDDKIIRPILIGLDINYEKPDNYSMQFSDNFRSSDKEFKIVDLLGHTISTASNVDFNKYNYSEFKDSGASTQVKDFINSALDVSKNAILNANNQDVKWDSSGICLRKSAPNGGYTPEEMRIINNCLAMTDDNWETAKMAIGKFTDKNLGSCWGIVAPNIAGTLLAGENLIIEAMNEYNNTLQFKVDGSGVYVNNGRILTSAGNGQVAIDPDIGFALGQNPLYTIDSNTKKLLLNHDNAKLFTDMNGNLTMKGSVYATDGIFKGTVYANSGKFKGVVQAEDFLNLAGKSVMTDDNKISGDYLDLMGVNVINRYGDTVFRIDQNGIDWNVVNQDPRLKEAMRAAENANSSADEAKRIAKKIANGEYSGTFINGKEIYSPIIYSNEFNVLPETIAPGGFNIYGYFERDLYHFLRLSYYESTKPTINFSSPDGAAAIWNFNRTEFSGTLDFNSANVTGLTAKFA